MPPKEAEIATGSSSLGPCQLTARSLLPRSLSRSHMELKSCRALSPAAPTWDSRVAELSRGHQHRQQHSKSSAHLACSPSQEDATLSRQGKGQRCSTLPNPGSQQATSFCAPRAGVRLCQRSCSSHMALRARQARMGTRLSLCPRGAAVLPAPASGSCRGEHKGPGHRAGVSSQQDRTAALLATAEETTSEPCKGRNKRSPQCPSPATGSSPSRRPAHASRMGEMLLWPRVAAGEQGSEPALPWLAPIAALAKGTFPSPLLLQPPAASRSPAAQAARRQGLS